MTCLVLQVGSIWRNNNPPNVTKEYSDSVYRLEKNTLAGFQQNMYTTMIASFKLPVSFKTRRNRISPVNTNNVYIKFLWFDKATCIVDKNSAEDHGRFEWYRAEDEVEESAEYP